MTSKSAIDKRHLQLLDSRFHVYAGMTGYAYKPMIGGFLKRFPQSVCLAPSLAAEDVWDYSTCLFELPYGDCPFSRYLAEQSLAHPNMVFIYSHASLNEVSQYLARFFIVEQPHGSPLYFEYCYPHMLRTYWHHCTGEERMVLHGPVACFRIPTLGAGLEDLWYPGVNSNKGTPPTMIVPRQWQPSSRIRLRPEQITVLQRFMYTSYQKPDIV